jgi:hypothetical protein
MRMMAAGTDEQKLAAQRIPLLVIFILYYSRGAVWWKKRRLTWQLRPHGPQEAGAVSCSTQLEFLGRSRASVVQTSFHGHYEQTKRFFFLLKFNDLIDNRTNIASNSMLLF